MYALVDANNFYVSCEQVFNPKLVGKPVIVLSNNDGCIISRSNEAKKLGLKMAEPAFNKKQYLKDHNVQVLSSNYTLYGDMSNRIISVLKMFSPKTEIYSIDESFLEFTNPMNKYLYETAKEIKHTILKCTGIQVTIGIGQTKAQAKIASHQAKKLKQYQGICILESAREVDCALRNTDVGDIWGIGRQYHKFLKSKNIITAWDFIQMNDNWIKKNLTVVGLRLKKELQGVSCIPLETMLPVKKAIATTRGFGKIVTKIDYLKEAVASYATRCSEKLRKQNSVASVLTVFIHTDPFGNDPYHHLSKTVHLNYSTNSQIELVKHAIKGLEMIFREDLRYKKAGVIVDGLESASSIQTGLFGNYNVNLSKRLSNATDHINKKYGRDAVKLAVQGDGKEWKLKQEMLSSRYTTRWSDIITVNC